MAKGTSTEKRLAESKIVQAVSLNSSRGVKMHKTLRMALAADGQANRTIKIGRDNVGRIAERIVANELEFRGFRVSDLNKEGTAANADLLAVSPSRKPLQIQVKGASNGNGPKDRLWVGYGYFTEQIIANKEQILASKKGIFNRKKGNFYKADIVVLVAVRSPKEYSCFVLPVKVAERAPQLHLAAYPYRSGPTHLELERSPRARKKDDSRVDRERKLLTRYRDEQGWGRLLPSN